MIRKGLFCPAIFILVLFAAVGALAQSSEEAAGQTAEQAGKLREAVGHYIAAFQPLSWSDSKKDTLQKKIIELSQKLQPAPAITEEAERRTVRGQAALKVAQSSADYETAAKEFLEAINQSPWWADAYFNLGLVREKQGEYQRAINNFKSYLLAKPNAADAKEVKAKIYELEFLQEKAQKDAAAKRETERRAAEAASNLERLSGTWIWRDKGFLPDVYYGYRVTVTGTTIEIVWSEYSGQSVERFEGKHFYRGNIEGRNINGTYSVDRASREGGRVFTYPFSGTVSEDGNVIQLRHTDIDITGAVGMRPTGWRESNKEVMLVRR